MMYGLVLQYEASAGSPEALACNLCVIDIWPSKGLLH